MTDSLYTCVVTTDGKCITTTDGKCVIVGVVPVPPSYGYSAPEPPKPIYLDAWLQGQKLVPISFDYDIIAQILFEMLAEMTGVKLDAIEKQYMLSGDVTILQQLISSIVGQKTTKQTLEQKVVGEKAYDTYIQVGLDGLKAIDISKAIDAEGNKLSQLEFEKQLSGTKLSLKELVAKLEGVKNKLLEQEVELTGDKLREAIKDYILTGDPDVRALLYLLFDEDEIENANIIQKLKDRKSWYFILEDEDEEEDE